MSNLKLLNGTYQASLWFKVVVGLIETSLGAVILLLSPDSLDDITQFTTALGQAHPSAFSTANYINIALSGSRLIIAAYLLIHGIPKILLGLALMQRKLWAYPIALVSLVVFMSFQIYEVVAHHSASMFVLTVIDIGIGLMIWREYKIDRARWAKTTAPETLR